MRVFWKRSPGWGEGGRGGYSIIKVQNLILKRRNFMTIIFIKLNFKKFLKVILDILGTEIVTLVTLGGGGSAKVT